MDEMELREKFISYMRWYDKAIKQSQKRHIRKNKHIARILKKNGELEMEIADLKGKIAKQDLLLANLSESMGER